MFLLIKKTKPLSYKALGLFILFHTAADFVLCYIAFTYLKCFYYFLGWQPGIQEGAADWDEDWDKFEDEGMQN